MAKRIEATGEPPLPQESVQEPSQTPPRARQTSQPECPYHKGVRCESRRSDPFFTRYYCPEKGCGFSIKVARPDIGRRVAQADQEDFSAR